MSPDCFQNKAQIHVCTCVHTYVHTNVQKVDQNTALNDTGVNLLTQTTTTANATKIGKVFQEANTNVSTVSVYVVHSMQ